MTSANNMDRAAVLALNSARNFLACLDAGRRPGLVNARRALKLVRKAMRQNARAAVLVAL